MFKVLVIVKKKHSRHDRPVIAELIFLFRTGLSCLNCFFLTITRTANVFMIL